MTKSNLSTRHHYIPKSYQKGFTEDLFYIFDKEKWHIQKNKRSPKAVFWEDERNISIDLNGNKTDIIETVLFEFLDNRFSNIIAELRESNENSRIDKGTYEEYFAFINLLRLRNPKYDNYICNIFNDNDFEDLGYNIIKKTDNSVLKDEIKNELKKNSLFIKSHSAILCFLPFLKKKKLVQDIIKNHSFAYHSTIHNQSLIGDNPIIFKSEKVDVKIFDEFIFSLSDKIFSVYIKDSKVDFKDNNFLVQKDVALLHQAKKYVACKDEEYLKKCVKVYESLIAKSYENSIIDNLFFHFKFDYRLNK